MSVTTPDAAMLAQLRDKPIEELAINTIRTLSMDAVQKAHSGHPGTPMALAPLAYVMWTRLMKHNPANVHWPDRDRFVLSAGHASMLLYSLLHLTGYPLPLAELVNFRQAGSQTPGHPENFLTPGVETTTGPLGQGLANAVGMAMAERHLAARFNRPGHTIVDHTTWVIASDGDLMEGVSHEAASLAGHLGLGKLVVAYDDNKITIDGGTDLAFSEDVGRRFEAYGWHVVRVGDQANDLAVLEAALREAQAETSRPSLVIVRTHIGWGAPKKQGTSAAHGEPLGEDEIKATKRNYGWPEDAQFLVPPAVIEHMDLRSRGQAAEAEWRRRLEHYRAEHRDSAAELEAAWECAVPAGWDRDVPTFRPDEGPLATRAASGKVINAFFQRLPSFFGGSADLTPSTSTYMKGTPDFSREHPEGRNVHWGVREHGMCGACNGLALHGGIRPFGATFLIFTDYCRPSIRLAALMGLPVTYVMTHDSIGLGEDGPTHQPIEQLPSLRAIHGLHVIRPGDANETAWAWRAAITRTDGPTLLALTRQALPILDRTNMGAADGVLRGGYVLVQEPGPALPDVILMATGSELSLVVDAGRKLAESGVAVRVVSLPCWERFRDQDAEYRNGVLPRAVTARVAVEAAAPMGWSEWVGDRGEVVAMNRYGASAPAKALFQRFGFHVENIVARAKGLLG